MKELIKYITFTEYMIIFVIIAVIVAIAIPQVLHTKIKMNEKACIGSLRALHSDQKTYKAYNAIYATMAQLRDTGIQSSPVTSPVVIQKAGYLFSDLIAAPTEDNYAVLASPVEPGSSGKKNFAITNTGSVRADPAVVKGFLTSNSAGIAAISASKLNDAIAAGSEQAGVDKINNNFEPVK